MTITLYEEEERAASDLFYAICILRIKKPHKQEKKPVHIAVWMKQHYRTEYEIIVSRHHKLIEWKWKLSVDVEWFCKLEPLPSSHLIINWNDLVNGVTRDVKNETNGEILLAFVWYGAKRVFFECTMHFTENQNNWKLNFR